jgi:inositol phosphorylceramide mannosyltransferase catalytic subunit
VVPRGATEQSYALRRLSRRIRIPPTFHQIWFGARPMPEEHRRFADGWRRRHPEWGYRLWTDADLPELSISPETVERAVTPSELSNLARYAIVARHGGVYVDTDFESFRSIESLLRGIDAFAACSFPGNVAPGFFGAVPGHPAVETAAALARRFVGLRYPESTTGPILFTHVLSNFPDVTVFPPELFYPYLWDEPEARHRVFDGAFAVHHWTLSWRVEG